MNQCPSQGAISTPALFLRVLTHHWGKVAFLVAAGAVLPLVQAVLHRGQADPLLGSMVMVTVQLVVTVVVVASFAVFAAELRGARPVLRLAPACGRFGAVAALIFALSLVLHQVALSLVSLAAGTSPTGLLIQARTDFTMTEIAGGAARAAEPAIQSLLYLFILSLVAAVCVFRSGISGSLATLVAGATGTRRWALAGWLLLLLGLHAAGQALELHFDGPIQAFETRTGAVATSAFNILSTFPEILGVLGIMAALWTSLSGTADEPPPVLDRDFFLDGPGA